VKSAHDFRRRRNLQWELLFKREAQALEGTMKEKRVKGSHKAVDDPFAHMRNKLTSARQAANAAQSAPPEAKSSKPGPPEADKSKRKRQAKEPRNPPPPPRKPARDEDGDISLPSADSSLAASPARRNSVWAKPEAKGRRQRRVCALLGAVCATWLEHRVFE
jgi:hypothetical protein